MKFCKINRILILYFITTNLFSQTLDPLLQRPWTEEVTKEEEKFYNRLSNIITKRKHYFLKNDVFGREYKIKWNGKIQFILNDYYRDTFPDSSQLDVHLAEADALVENGNYIEPVRLLKGINLCNRLLIKNKIVDLPKNYEDSSKMLNSLFAKFSHKEDQIKTLTDPYGCFFEDKQKNENVLVIESEPFSYRFKIGTDFIYNFPDKEDDIFGKENDFSWKVFRMVKRNSLKTASKKTLEEELRISSDKLLNLREDKLIFFIGMTFHFTNLIYTKDNYYLLWDLRRGLSKNQMRQINFKREKVGSYYESTFRIVSESGISKTVGVKEKYYLRKNKGLFFALSYPYEKKNESDDEWNLILKSLDVK